MKIKIFFLTIFLLTINTNCSKPTVDEDDIGIIILNGSIILENDVIELRIINQSGRVVENSNLSGIYTVVITYVDGSVTDRKIFVN